MMEILKEVNQWDFHFSQAIYNLIKLEEINK